MTCVMFSSRAAIVRSGSPALNISTTNHDQLSLLSIFVKRRSEEHLLFPLSFFIFFLLWPHLHLHRQKLHLPHLHLLLRHTLAFPTKMPLKKRYWKIFQGKLTASLYSLGLNPWLQSIHPQSSGRRTRFIRADLFSSGAGVRFYVDYLRILLTA